MILENEIIMLLIGVGGMVFLFNNRDKLVQVRHWKLITTAFLLLLLSWCLTVIEGYVLPVFLNLMEHLCYAAGSVVMAIWFWQVFVKGGGENG